MVNYKKNAGVMLNDRTIQNWSIPA